MSEPKLAAKLLGNADKVLPVLGVLVVLYSVVVAGKVRPFHAARVRGGPTEGATHLSYRVEVMTCDGVLERPAQKIPVAVELETPEGVVTATGETDDEGALSVSFTTPRPVSGVAHLRASTGREQIADDAFRVSPAEWAGGARRRGGWVTGRPGPLMVRAAAARGVFAVPFADPLVVDVVKEGGRFSGTLMCECPGEHGEPSARVPLLPSPNWPLPVGRQILPLEHATEVQITAADADGTSATLALSLAVVPGALRASLWPGGVHVESPIQRDRAYVAVVSERERISGGTVPLQNDPRGISWGFFRTELPGTDPLWAVVSSEPDLRSPALVGWPLRFAPGGDPPKTLDVADVLVVDAVGRRSAAELARARRARFFSGAVAASALLLTALLVARRAKLAKEALESHLERAGADGEVATRVARTGAGAVWVVLASVLALVFAATLVGFFAAAL